MFLSKIFSVFTSTKDIVIDQTQISGELYKFINSKVIPGTDISIEDFWKNFVKVINELAPENKALLKKRSELQEKINKWHILNKDKIEPDEYKNFLKEIGYLVEEKDNFKIQTTNVDDEISKIAGPQLVVPIDNARYALNAANARWGSLYDALYGTDLISEEDGCEKSVGYNPQRGKKVIELSREFLDVNFKIENGSWEKVKKFNVDNGNLKIEFDNGSFSKLKSSDKFIGFDGDKQNLKSILLKNNNLHVEIRIDANHLIGKVDKANISDIIIESAISTIMDLEDSVAAVDAEDKIRCYSNWLGIMKGDLQAKVKKGGKTVFRKLSSDKEFFDRDGNPIKLHGRSLLLIRNVGHLMTSSAIKLNDGSEVPEGIMDAFITVMCAKHDFKLKMNSRKGSVYIVKPKMHGPEEVAFTDKIFRKVEEVLKLNPNTIKIGIMDEERRTTVNLKECIRNVKNRIVFINTGFLDRTGDEMHTSFEAGTMIFKGEMKKSTWLNTYEDWNVDIGLECGFSGIAQIGKGMWAMPDKMQDMMKQKIGHPNAGANCAWVPSPTAATLHSTHYHQVNVFDKHKELSTRERANLDDILNIPITDRPNWPADQIEKEIENNCQGILGYVVRWIDQGVGCSKVPDINNIGLMEDRATLRISSQHIANWLHHQVCTKEQVLKAMKKMASIVDQQNSKDQNYSPMAQNFDGSIAFKAACDLIFEGKLQPSGYTEPILHKKRLEKKSAN
ncbi:MAG: malate synthase G [Pelagibacteraceae bacterium TMED136]|nr:MAG: malate synthase G [Pelagibacteraceae bacterium TMED136]